ncbi:MAG: adhesin [Methanobrevibacter millerae]|uniref:Adhesin n=1 Tax=Methanobrevibacter millerae TaxID=230361 RepID=A0A8T3VC42_9EURY|nr:right-handed parallel beta-helix repeat-containing protein [Methanobrevibacter millerae]MBE6505699.1 adhesin [Methanobrevibacter millerae]
MNKKINMVLILLLLLIVSVGAVSAADNSNETLSVNDNTQGDEILTATNYTVTENTYGNYFTSKGEMSSSINAGDTLILSGDFSGKNFTINKQITLTGSGGTIKNGVITLTKDASGTVITGLTIKNTNDFLYGIHVNGATNCEIHDNFINNTGQSSYCIVLNKDSDFNKIEHNTLSCYGESYGHGTRSSPVILLGSADNNYIADNDVYCADANAIYLSSYTGGPFKGGESFNNVIYNNTITYTTRTTSWAYAIQLMGGNNTVDSNKIYGGYRGVSSSNNPLNKVINNYIFVDGTDFSSGAHTGGDYGIAVASNATVRNNTITGMFVGSAISAGDNSLIENNIINASKGYGIEASGDDVKIIENTIYTNTSAAVRQQGKMSGIVVDRNTIVSQSGIGVYLSKSSKTKYPSNITITNNNITTSNQYMINAADADKDTWVISGNMGTGKILTPSGEVDPSAPDFNFNGTIHNVTPANYHNFIDGDGNLKNDFVHDGDILNFIGTFENKKIYVTSSVKLTGQNPVFINSTICALSDSVWIENLTIRNSNTSHNAWGIYVTDTNIVKILNNDIYVVDPKTAYTIYIHKSSKIYIENNTLTSHGDALTYTLLGDGAEECEIKDNIINCIGTGEIYPFENSRDINGNSSEVCIAQCICLGDTSNDFCLDGTNIVPELYRTYGILMIHSSNNTLTGNDVRVTSLVNESNIFNSTNSLVGIDFYYDCDNNIISGNKVNVTGLDNYLYGVGAIAHPTGGSGSTAINNVFKNNEIYVNGGYMAEGIVFGPGCNGTQALNNTVSLTAENVTYGVNLESSFDSTLKDNIILMNCDVVYGIEAYGSDGNVIEYNTINGEGKLVSGFVGINTNNNIIQNNIFNSNGTDSDKNITHDVIKATNSGVYLEGSSKGNLIDSNSITTELGYPVVLSADSTGNTVTYNYLKGEKGSGDEGVNGSASNTVHDNYASTFDNLVMDNVTVEYRGNATITLEDDDEGEGANVEFKLGDVVIGNATLENGKATINYVLDKTTNVGNYTLTARVSKYGFRTEEITSQLSVEKSNITVTVDDVKAKAGSQAEFKATLIDINNNPISDVEVKFYRNANYIGSGKTNENGIVIANINIPSSLKGNYSIFAIVGESDNYRQSSGEGKLILAPKNLTKLSVDDVTLYYKDGTNLIGQLTDDKGNALSGMLLSIIINGQTMKRTTDSEGKFGVPINLNPGVYPVEVKFEGNSQYEASSANATVTVKHTIVSDDIELMYKNGTRFYVSLMEDGKPIANERILLNINGVIYTRTTNAQGSTSIAINLEPNEYIVTTAREATGEMKSNKILVKSLLVENKDVDMFFKNGTRYTVKVIKQDGTVAGAGETVTFNINGVFYERTTNAEGIAGLNLNLEPNNYIITAMYEGCAVANNIKVKHVLHAEDLTKKYGTADQFTVNVVDGQGNPLANATVIFNINGVFYYRVSNATGTAKLNINLMPGQYIITSSFNGENIANKVTVTS